MQRGGRLCHVVTSEMNQRKHLNEPYSPSSWIGRPAGVACFYRQMIGPAILVLKSTSRCVLKLIRDVNWQRRKTNMCRARPVLELTENPLYSQVKYQTSLSSPRGTFVLYRGSGNTLSLVFGCGWAFWLSFNNNNKRLVWRKNIFCFIQKSWAGIWKDLVWTLNLETISLWGWTEDNEDSRWCLIDCPVRPAAFFFFLLAAW